MTALLDERRKRQREFREDVKDAMPIPAVESDRGLGNLVESVKRKRVGAERHLKKRRKA